MAYAVIQLKTCDAQPYSLAANVGDHGHFSCQRVMGVTAVSLAGVMGETAVSLAGVMGETAVLLASVW